MPSATVYRSVENEVYSSVCNGEMYTMEQMLHTFSTLHIKQLHTENYSIRSMPDFYQTLYGKTVQTKIASTIEGKSLVLSGASDALIYVIFF